MTDKVNPSQFRPAEAFKTAGAIAYGGHGGGGFISPAASPTDISVQDGGIDETVLNAFAQTSSASSFDVTIDPGEAFVFGSWLAIDTSTTVTLASSTTGQTVYVGWNKDGTNDVIIGLSSAFDNASGNTDERIPLFTFDTDGSGVTSVTDERTIGQSPTVESDLDIPNDTAALFGDDGDFSIEYDSVSDELELTDEINNTIKQTWDKSGDVHIPNGALNFRNNNSIDSSGTESIAFDGTGRVDIPNGDLRLATGQAIEDGSGTKRLDINNSNSVLRDDEGRSIFAGANGVSSYAFSYSNQPVKIYDSEGDYTAVKYETDTSAGVLRTPNAGMRVEGDGSLSDGAGIEQLWTGTVGIIQTYDHTNSVFEELSFKGSLYNFSRNAANLRLATGRAIEDGSGTNRIDLFSGSTVIKDETGSASLNADASQNGGYIQKSAGTGRVLFDREGSFDAVQYETDTSAGVLRTPNAGIRVEDVAQPSSGVGVEIGYNGTNGLIRTYDRDNNVNVETEVYGSPLRLNGTGGVVDMSLKPANLRLATGQSIEDGSGNSRININSGNTSLSDGGSGSVAVTLSGTSGADIKLTNGLLDLSSGGTPNLRLATGQSIEDGGGDARLRIRSNDTILANEDGGTACWVRNNNWIRVTPDSATPFVIRDTEGGFDAIQYTTSSSAPGTLELRDAVLELSRYGFNNGIIAVQRADNGTYSQDIQFETDATNDGGFIRGSNQNDTTEVEAVDGDGNTTILT